MKPELAAAIPAEGEAEWLRQCIRLRIAADRDLNMKRLPTTAELAALKKLIAEVSGIGRNLAQFLKLANRLNSRDGTLPSVSEFIETHREIVAILDDLRQTQQFWRAR